MEGEEMSPSHHSEESSVLDLPSVGDLVEPFLPPHGSESSEELFGSGDTFPSPPTGASTVPVAKEHPEEMVRDCIVEVLSKALLKPNMLSIDPACRDILRKGDRNDREGSATNQLEVRHLKDTAETEKHLPGSLEEGHRQAEEEAKESVNGSGEENDKSKEEEDGHQAAAEERLHREEKKHYQEMREEEKSYQSEEESKTSQRLAKKVELAVLNKKSSSGGLSTEQLPAGSQQHPTGHWHLEEGRQSPYKRVPEGERGEAEEERSGKPEQESKEGDFSWQQERAESEKREETQEEKPPYSPRSYGKHRGGDSSEEKRGRGGEEEESSREEAQPWDRRNHYQKLGEASQQQQQQEKKRAYHGRHGSEEVEKRPAGQGREEYRERWQQSEESSKEEEEEKRHQHGEEKRHRSQGRTGLGGASEEGLDRDLGGGSEEQPQGHRSSRWGGQGEGPQAAYAGHRGGQPRTHHGAGDGAEQLRDLRNGREETEEEEKEEEVAKQHQSSDQVEDAEEGRYAEREGSRSSLPAKWAIGYSFFPLRWPKWYSKRDGARKQQGKEEGSPSLAEKSPIPEYSNYRRWKKQQELRQQQQGSSAGGERQRRKEQKMAQLVSCRRKDAGCPELLSSREDTKRRQVGMSKRSLSQRPLTEEEENELENLAAMELELQKIAQKFKDSRRG
ncbi:secretogranin-1 [Indicator indicator]|uniref:secretogranin-1 n=1 Tax=Indicator indicator TaxID=1002788 RepID=UPI0023DE8C9B|nr:secretogranin-1 [Indicator indicator]